MFYLQSEVLGLHNSLPRSIGCRGKAARWKAGHQGLAADVEAKLGAAQVFEQVIRHGAVLHFFRRNS